MLLPFRKKYNNRSGQEKDWTIAKLIKTYTDCFKALNKGFEIDGFSLDNYSQNLMDRAETELNRRGYTILEQPPELYIRVEN